MKDKKDEFFFQIIKIVGLKNLLFSESQITPFSTGVRVGSGKAEAVILPENLLQLWNILEILVKFKKIIIIQAANTGLTGGSTPDGDKYDRDVVIVNTLKIKKLFLLKNASQVLALPGSTLYDLEAKLENYNREPHSVIGSSCIGASIIGGICNGSGGNLLQRGPAYTELSLFAQVDNQGILRLINHLNIDLGNSPLEILKNLDNFESKRFNIFDNEKIASDNEYKMRIRDVDSKTPARFNADKRRLYEASGCSGKLCVFAVRLDTFPKSKETKIVFLATNEPKNFTNIKNHILLRFNKLPDICEYMHKTFFDGADKYGKDTFLVVKYFGPKFMPILFKFKQKMEIILSNFKFINKNIMERILQKTAEAVPDHLPKIVRDFRKKYEHFLILSVSDECIKELNDYFTSGEFRDMNLEFHQFDEKEGKDLLLHRFVAGAAPKRNKILNPFNSGEILPFDVALPRNCKNWYDILPEKIYSQMSEIFLMGHFMCMVFHWDFIVKKGVDVNKLKKEIIEIFNEHNIKYPAEHNYGHYYKADKNLLSHYVNLDPTNTFNPGIGQTSKNLNYK